MGKDKKGGRFFLLGTRLIHCTQQYTLPWKKHLGLPTESNRSNHLPSARCRVCDGRAERAESTSTTTATTGTTDQCRYHLREPTTFRALSTRARETATTGEQIEPHELTSDGQSGQETSNGHGPQRAGHGPVRARHVVSQRLGRPQGQVGCVYLFQDCCRSGKFYLRLRD